ncbi:5-formyltetrahydrofolate cyclo-ligase [Paucibacter sp. APW11]|uniref:5-formyltetrahydrofolate cyclo-ligase n=1 Tax=Roseateles aquae TaxID=3077235 RepID=A0ABU3PAN7_9BURK|nr:5-formyltetrahydrofolate cyclo-ligase [Paucibacter sp. APW11]MDT8999657.1 5-formyltetrahydrofolate cyclo-ligase [Paucibacter sp. APW11]
MRAFLLQRRREWLTSPQGAGASAALAEALPALLQQLEPECLGLYWPLDGEFDAAELARQQAWAAQMQLALPSAYKQERKMEFRRWDGETPSTRDECGIPCASGAVVLPDVLLVPCVGFSRAGYRLGYGGGYFDRWLARHPGVTTIGLAWSVGEATFAVEAHDQPLTLVLTERELISP